MGLITFVSVVKMSFCVLAVALGILIQFVPNLEMKLDPFFKKFPFMNVLRFRIAQLLIGFALISIGLKNF